MNAVHYAYSVAANEMGRKQKPCRSMGGDASGNNWKCNPGSYEDF